MNKFNFGVMFLTLCVIKAPAGMIMIASSPDGIAWSATGRVAASGSSVGAMWDSGSIHLYYMGGRSSAGGSNLYVTKSQDGLTFDSPVNIPSFALAGTTACDPEVVKLSDGKFRMYYYESLEFCSDKELPKSTVFSIASAISSDGINFTKESGYRFQYNKIMDPIVTHVGQNRLGQDVWRMYGTYNAGLESKTISAISTDGGWTFSYEGALELKGPDGSYSFLPALVSEPGGYRMYFTTVGNSSIVYSGLSTDGVTFKPESGVRLSYGGLMTVTKASNGYWMYYATPNYTPVGYFDGIVKDSNGRYWAGGWAWDQDSPNGKLNIHFYADGKFIGTADTSVYRSDVNSLYNVSGYHGFAYQIQDRYRNSTIEAYAIDAQGDGSKSTKLIRSW